MLYFGPRRLSLEVGAQDLAENIIEIPEDFSFENILNIYKTYTLKSNKIVINLETSEEITDDEKLLKKLEFANLWRKCASGNLSDETDEIAMEICFCDEAKETYNKISKLAMFHLSRYGYIDTKEILDITKEMNYRWSRQTARKLFKSQGQAQLITTYYRLATPDAKKEIMKTLTTDEALYGS